MKRLSPILILPLAAFLFLFALCLTPRADAQQASFLLLTGSGDKYLKPVNALWGLQWPGLATSTTGCLSVATGGWISASGSACGSGSGGFSTTSADYWKDQRNFFSTTSSDYWKTQNNFFSTTSADYWKTQNNFFSTTSSDYWKTQNNFFSTTSADYYVHSSTTIPKTYTANAFTAHNTFTSLNATLASSTNATSTNFDITNLFTFNGVTASTWPAFCQTITGGAGLCDGTDATGAAGTIVVSTSTNETAGQLTYWTSTSGTPALLGQVATGTVSSANSALTVTANRSVIGGALSLTISTTTTTMFTGTEGQILAYTANGWTGVATTTFSGGLTYSGGNVTNTMTAGDGITRNTDDLDCDTASASVFGCLAAADWTTFNSKLGSYDAFTHPSATVSATTSGMIFTASSTILSLTTINSTSTNATTTNLYVTNPPTFSTLTSALLLTGAGGLLAEYAGSSCTNQSVTAISALGAATCTTINGNYLDLTANYAWTGAHDFGGGVIEITNGASPTVDAIGEIALDTTQNELLIATSTTASDPIVIKPYEWKGFAFGSTTQGSGSTTKPFFIAPPSSAGYFDSITCHATSTTATKAFFRVVLRDETNNRTNDLIASSTEGVVKLTTNQAFTGSEVISAETGTTTNIAADLFGTCWVKIIYTRN